MRLARGAFIADFGLVFDLSNTKVIYCSIRSKKKNNHALKRFTDEALTMIRRTMCLVQISHRAWIVCICSSMGKIFIQATGLIQCKIGMYMYANFELAKSGILEF